LGEINWLPELAWRKSIAVFEEGKDQPSTPALYAEDRREAEIADKSMVRCVCPSCDCVGRGSGEPAGWRSK